MDAYTALADPTRREILRLLDQGPLESSEIARHFTISKPAISKHLKKLLEGALVSRSTAAQRRIYEVNPDGFAELESWLSSRRGAWESRLDNLQKFLEKSHEKI